MLTAYSIAVQFFSNPLLLTQTKFLWILGVTMTYDQVLRHFGSLTQAAQALDVERQNVHNWGARRRIPSKWQLKIESMSRGVLKADASAKREAQEIVSYIRRNGKARA